MAELLTKTKRYFNEYIGQAGKIKLLVIPVVLCLILANHLEVQYTNSSARMTTKVSDVAVDDRFALLKMYIVYFIICHTLKLMVNLFNANFIAMSIRSGFRNFFYEYFTVKYAVFQSIGIGEAQYNIMRRAYTLSDFLTTVTMSFISNFFFFLIVVQSVNASISGMVKLVMFVLLLGFLAFSIFIQMYRSKIRRRVNDGLQENSRKLYDILFNYERIITYDNLDVECEKYWDSMHQQTVYGSIYWVTYEIVNFLNTFFFLILNIFLLKQYNSIPTMSSDSLKEFMMLVTKLSDKLVDISRNIDEICTSFTNLDQSVIENAPQDENNACMQITTFKDAVALQDMSFGYDGKLLFKGVSCVVPKGRKVAITGVNGAGKSTFVKILLGLYDYEGSIYIDGIECRRLTKHCIRDLISYIPQNSFLFDGTVRDNLVLGNRELSDAKLVEYCKLYKMHDSFKALGYDADVGERGMNLSGGQKQKVCFMRSIIKNSPILILDEATSNMDAASELSLINTIKENMQGTTVFMIIHNLALLHNFDEVLFFDNQTLEEHGDFKSLYASNGRFTAFYNDAIKAEH